MGSSNSSLSYLIANAGVTERCSKLAHAYAVAAQLVGVLSVANGGLFLAVEAVPSWRAVTSEIDQYRISIDFRKN